MKSYCLLNLSMRWILLLVSFLLLNSCSGGQPITNSQPVNHQLWDTLLQKHVTKDGHVDYKGFKNDHAQLQQYLNLLSSHYPDPATWSTNEQKAYWLNAYNAFTIELILQHYPLKSIKDITTINIPLVHSPWQIKFFKLGGKAFNLDEIEHGILRKQFKDPRIHCCLVCASRSCPVLRNEAFMADKLDAQMDDQARLFVNDTAHNQLSADHAKLSKIFDWYAGDFKQQGGVIAFINRYADTQLSPKAKLSYLDYDWSLNE